MDLIGAMVSSVAKTGLPPFALINEYSITTVIANGLLVGLSQKSVEYAAVRFFANLLKSADGFVTDRQSFVFGGPPVTLPTPPRSPLAIFEMEFNNPDNSGYIVLI